MTKQNLIRYAAALLFTAALASCNKEDADLPGSGNGGGEISFEIGFAPRTRAATDVDFNSVWENGDEIGVFAVASGQSLSADAQKNHIHNAKLTHNNGTWTQETALYWPTTASGNTSLDFYAYYPYDATATDPTAIAFNVMADQSGTTDRGGEDIPNYNLCDLLTARTSGKARGAVVNLTFYHALAMVQVTIDPALIKVTDPAEVSVTLLGVKTGASLDLGAASGPAAVAVASDNDAAGIKMYRLEQPQSTGYDKTYTFRALVPAQTVAAGTSLFRIGCGGELFGSEALAGDHILKAGVAELFGQAPVYDDYALQIPDPTFREYCLDKFDTDGNGKLSLSEVEAVTTIDYAGPRIESLEGIKYFTNLQSLDCSGNILTSLDLSGLGKLQSLDCSRNFLSSLDLSGCGNLQSLNCHKNSLTRLDASGCANLQILDCSFNYSLTSLDLSGCNNLQTLDCQSNSLTSLDLSGCGNLQELWFRDNLITSIDLTGCDNLQRLDCSFNSLESLDASGCRELKSESLAFSNNPLKTLNFSGCASLQSLSCNYYNQLTSLDVSGCVNLQTLDCSLNSLESLHVSGCGNLQTLYCYNNSLTSLDVSGCANLRTLYCNNNSLTSLEVSGCGNLQTLYCYNNSLTSLDVSGCMNLQTLYCEYNSLTSLDVSGCGNLQTLDCSLNSLTSLDVSGCGNLQRLYCNDNSLSSLDVSGRVNLQELYCNDNSLTSLDVSDCRNLQTVLCDNNSLTSLDVTGFGNLQRLDCYNNPLTELDVSENSALQLLLCGDRGETNLIVWTSHTQQLSTSQTPGYLYVRVTYGSGGTTMFEAISQKGETNYGVTVKDKQ